MTQARRPDHPIHPMFTQRWSPRAFTGEAISESELFTLLEAGRWAPSAYNSQPWRFVYARRGTPAWNPIFEALVGFNQGWTHSAAALVVIVSATESAGRDGGEPNPNPWHAFDSGAAWASIAFQATLLGWSTHAMAGYEAEQLAQAIALPARHVIEAVVAIGRRGKKELLDAELQEMESPNNRRPLTELVEEGRFGAGA